MKNYEKILIGITILLFGVQLLPDFPGKWTLFTLSVWLLAISYFIGGYLLLNPKENKRYFIPIVAGLAFATSLFVLPFTIILRINTLYGILPLLNLALFLGLGIYLIIKRKSKDIVQLHKSIFIRSTVILVVVGFFSFSPISFKLYRNVLIALNNGNEHIVENLRMFGYTEAYEKALESGNCEQAIHHAERANESGKNWLGIPKIEDDNSRGFDAFAKQNQLWKISGTFSNLYNAYKCKADESYNNSAFEEALKYYLKADKALNACDHNSDTWLIEQAYSLNQLALCYKKMHNYEKSDQLFVEAIERYHAIKDTHDINVARFYSNLAESLGEQLLFEYSNMIYKTSITILKRDETNEENKEDIIKNYHGLIKNHLQADSLEQAMFFIDETFLLAGKSSVDVCITNLYKGICLYKLSNYKQADKVLTNCITCFEKLLEPADQNIAENHLALALVKLTLADYNLAKNHLEKGMQITTTNFGKNSARYASYLKAYANLDMLLGNYKKSEKSYRHAFDLYTNELGERNRKLPEILSGLAELELVLGKFEEASAHSDSSLSIANYYVDLNTPSISGLINNAAYVKYYLADYKLSTSLYQKTLAINQEFGLENTATTAIAFNGLGLVMTAKENYKAADSLFLKSLKLYKEIFTENHPLTAVVYLNYATLQLKENKLKQAREMLDKSQSIHRKFYAKEHDVFADIYVAYGDLARKENKHEVSKEYYRKALSIYLVKFDKNHIKVLSTQSKLSK